MEVTPKYYQIEKPFSSKSEEVFYLDDDQIEVVKNYKIGLERHKKYSPTSAWLLTREIFTIEKFISENQTINDYE